jgi:uncharacterized membrane protein YkoI
MRKFIIALLAGVSLALIAPLALADHHLKGYPPVSMSTVLGQLEHQGYYDFDEVEYDHGSYEVKAYNAQGQRVKLHYNPTLPSTPAVKPKQDSQQLTMAQAAKKVEAAGYSNIYKIELEHGWYEVKAMGKNGKKVEWHVDPQTGKISKYVWASSNN